MQGTTALLTHSIQILENNTFYIFIKKITKFLSSPPWPERTFSKVMLCKKSPFSLCDGRNETYSLLGLKYNDFLSSGCLALGILTSCKNIWQNDEVSSLEAENEDLSLACRVVMEKIMLQHGVYLLYLSNMNTAGSTDLQKCSKCWLCFAGFLGV